MNLFREPSHFIVLIVLLALLFGWKKLPDMARSLGRSMRIFKSEVSEMKNDGTARPSPAASDTVAGDVVPPAGPAQPSSTTGPAPSAQPAPSPQPATPRDDTSS